MTLSEVANIANIVAALSLVVSAIAVFHELQQNNKLAKAKNTGALVDLVTPFAMSLIQDRTVAEFYVHGAEKYAAMDEVDQYRYKNILWWWLVHHENIFYQWRQRLLDQHTYKAWENDLRVFIRRQNLQNHWDELAGQFQDEFARHIGMLLKESAATGPTAS